MTVVVAYSADALGRAAVSHGAAEATLRGERLVVVNATRGDAYVDPRFAGEGDVAGLRQSLDDLGVDADIRQSMSPDVADEVLAVVADENADLLVVGLRRRTAVGKLVLGSVAQRLVLDAPCAVLAVKAPAAPDRP